MSIFTVRIDLTFYPPYLDPFYLTYTWGFYSVFCESILGGHDSYGATLGRLTISPIIRATLISTSTRGVFSPFCVRNFSYHSTSQSRWSPKSSVRRGSPADHWNILSSLSTLFFGALYFFRDSLCFVISLPFWSCGKAILMPHFLSTNNNWTLLLLINGHYYIMGLQGSSRVLLGTDMMGPPIGRDIRSRSAFIVVALFVIRKEGGRPCCDYPFWSDVPVLWTQLSRFGLLPEFLPHIHRSCVLPLFGHSLVLWWFRGIPVHLLNY